MTGHELYEFIKNDPELISIIQQGLVDGRTRQGKKPGLRRKATREFERFWSSQHASYFRMMLERKLGADLATRVMRGREARIEPVMILIVDDILRKLESQEV